MSKQLYQNQEPNDINLALAAVEYAQQGIPVYPLYGIDGDGCKCGSAECKHPGKHPHGRLARHGMLDATTEVNQVRSWWDQEPRANIGTPTGEMFHRFVVDIDARHGGWDTADLLEDQYGHWPSTFTVSTGGGGLHIHLQYPKGIDIRSKAGILGPGIDIRANGGSAILPPSLHASGNRYEWTYLVSEESGDRPVSLARAPMWLLTLAQAPMSFPRIVPPDVLHRGTGTKERCRDDGGTIGSGQRNAELASKAGAMRGAGFTQDEILVALLKLNADRCSPPLPEREVQAIARSISRYNPNTRTSSHQSPQGFTPIRVSNGKVA
ncbi:MAG: bifunctional DNA primase/polymerase [Thermomicrobiales bacterium]